MCVYTLKYKPVGCKVFVIDCPRFYSRFPTRLPHLNDLMRLLIYKVCFLGEDPILGRLPDIDLRKNRGALTFSLVSRYCFPRISSGPTLYFQLILFAINIYVCTYVYLRRCKIKDSSQSLLKHFRIFQILLHFD